MTLPEIVRFSEVDFNSEFSLITAAGFEDRTEAIFESVKEHCELALLTEGICIDYLPEMERNRKAAVDENIRSLGIPENNMVNITFDRFQPDDFRTSFVDVANTLENSRILLDISGMSKYLIMLILDSLSEYDVEVVIFYAEAEVYYPSKSHFESEWESEPDDTPAFLTYDVYDIITSRTLSSLTKSGQPVITIAFPSFNYQKMVALASELSPHLLVTIFGIPHLEKDKWREKAIKDLNQDINSYISTREEDASTFDYQQTYDVLDQIYDEYADAYRLVLAPTGSKLQTVAASIFRLVRSDIQVVYPVMAEFDENYTEGWKATWAIELGQLDNLAEELGSETDTRLQSIKVKIDELNSRTEMDG